MRIVLTNDDGVDAPGLAALRQATEGLGDLLVVAPALEWSGCGHRVTTDRAFRVERRADAVVVHGTPADCVRVALEHLAPTARLVLSGINPGGNLGSDVYHSGTIAAAREAALHGCPAMAFSHYRGPGHRIDWRRAAQWVRAMLPALIARPPRVGGFLSVNLPSLAAGVVMPEVVDGPLDPSPLPLSFVVSGEDVRYAGDYHQRRRRPGHDVDVCFGGRIAVTRLSVGASPP